jgi:hypothetical protein
VIRTEEAKKNKGKKPAVKATPAQTTQQTKKKEEKKGIIHGNAQD